MRQCEYSHCVPRASTRSAHGLFAACSDPLRLRLLLLLRGREVCVCHLVGALVVPQPTVSRHLAVLRRTGLVRCRKEGLWCYYALARAEDALHTRVVDLLGDARSHVPEAAADAARLKKILNGCCA